MSDFLPRLQEALADRYSIDREIGRGGMSIVYLARDLPRNRFVALKVLRPDLGAVLGPDRFLDEIQVAAGLAHPHILPLFDSGVADGLLFYTMPYVEGESLRQRLTREHRLPVAEAVSIACDVAEALAYAHTRNIVHRDIKPENILLEAGHPVISDFGIARAIREADESRKTGTGLVVGTAGYMSPEQATGQKEIDGRSDIYSLGCVLYEMLVGRTPSSERTSLISERQDVPLEVQLAIETALAEQPGERYATAGEFAAALRLPQTISSATKLRRKRRRWMAGSAVTVVALATVGAVVLPKLAASSLDPSLYIVVPFGHRGGSAPALVNGDQCELLLSQAFGRWTDVRLADPLEVHDARAQLGNETMTLDGAKELARKLGAGMLVWGDVVDVGDSTQVTAALYDLRHGGKQLRDYSVRIPKDGSNLAAKFRKLADSILLGGTSVAHSQADVVGTNVLGAFYGYAEGSEALQRWDLPAAERSFRVALQMDPDYAQASLWLAHAQMWSDEPTADWRPTIARALASPQKLGAKDLALARALWSLADKQFPDACQRYRRITDNEPRNFIAWFGLGECQRRDQIVEPDPTSPSGWRFRASYRAAATAYQRALDLVPSAHRALTRTAVSRLINLFFAETYWYRDGYTVGPETMTFGAFPSLDQDTLAFIPWPIGDFISAKGGSRPPTMQAAVSRNRDALRSSILKWLGAFPASPDAFEALSYILETAGEIDVGPPQGSALEAIRRARALTRDSAQALRTAVAETRLLFKLEHFANAARLADSILENSSADLGPGAARPVAGLALLTGRVYRAAQLLQRSAPLDTPMTWDGDPVPDAPMAVKQAALSLLAYAALSGPAESLRVGKKRVDERVSGWAGAASRERLRLAVLHVPMGLAFETIGISDVHRREAGGDYVLEMQYNFTHGDTVAVRRELQRQGALRTRVRAGDVAINGTYGEARLLLQLHDTAAAIGTLDNSLHALPTLGSYLMEQPEQIGCAIRAMALRAELAARAGDNATASQWAHAVATLWSNADAPLRATTARMRELFH